MARIPEQSGSTLAARVTGVDGRATWLERHTEGWINVRSPAFGATGDGVTDDTAAIQAALTAAASLNGGVVLFPPPAAFYKVTAPLKVPHRTVLRGSFRSGFVSSYSADLCRIQKTTTTTVPIERFDAPGTYVDRDVIFYVDPAWSAQGSGGSSSGYYPQSVVFENLVIKGSAGTSTAAVYVEQGSGITIRDCDISGVKHAFLGRDVWSSSFERVKGQARFEVTDGGTSLVFERVAAGGNADGFDGIHLSNVLYSTLIACTNDAGRESAYNFTNCKGLTVISPGAESSNGGSATQGWMFAFKGNNSATVIGASPVSKNGAAYPIVSAGNGDQVTFIGADFRSKGTGVTSVDVYVDPVARLSFQNSYYLDQSNNNPAITFGSSGSNASTVLVHYEGNWARRIDGASQQNAMPASSVFRAAAGEDAFTMTSGARINLGSALLLQGAGSPESAVTAPVGSLFLRTDGSTSTTLYVKTSGTGNTGWTAK